MKITIVEEDSIVWDEVEFKFEDLDDTGIRCILLEIGEDLERLKVKLSLDIYHFKSDSHKPNKEGG